MSQPIHVAVLFGGKSAEHEISILSARNIVKALNPERYQVSLIGIDPQGHWHALEQHQLFELNNLNALPPGSSLSLQPGMGQALFSTPSHLCPIEHIEHIDVIFPVLHGPYGEDGTLQGLLKLVDIPFVGSGVLASAIGMDKDIMKRLLRDAGIPIVKFVTCYHHLQADLAYENIVAELGLPFFVKPANAGSSIGISKVHHQTEFSTAIALAFSYDRKIILETAISGRELECSVLGNEHPIVSLPGEIIPQHDFYSYQAKYLDKNGALFSIPAQLSTNLTQQIQALALDAFKVLECAGLARVDCFVTLDEQIYINEVNTMPGFTAISMYPQLWQASGIGQSELMDRLIQLAFERHQADAALKTSYELS